MAWEKLSIGRAKIKVFECLSMGKIKMLPIWVNWTTTENTENAEGNCFYAPFRKEPLKNERIFHSVFKLFSGVKFPKETSD